MIVLRYEDGDIRVMLVSNCVLVRIFVIPEACTYGLSRYALKLEHDLFFIVFLMSGGWGRAMVFSY